MAKNKQCCYCGTRDRKETYRRLPNGLFSCVDCHRQHNPMWIAGAVHSLTKADKGDMLFKTEEEEKQFDEAVKKAKKAPPMHHTEASPIIRQAYKLLLKGKRVKV